MGEKFTAGATPSVASALLAGVQNSLPIVGQILNATGLKPQDFATISVTNTRISLYTLSIQSPEAPGLAYASYTFPIAPQNISKRYTALANTFDVNGPPDQGGVQRIVDVYGNTPVTYFIEGTTGWKKHATDAFTLTGTESILALQNLLSEYASLNAAAAAANQPAYTLEFYDYFTGDYWQVEPVGEQEVRQSADKPLYMYYRFRLAGIRNLSSPFANIIDTIAQILNNPAQATAGLVGQIGGDILRNYAGNTPGAASILRFFNLT